jgi:hypothetical protein
MEKIYQQHFHKHDYIIEVMELEGILYWRVENFKGRKKTAKKLQERCGYPIKDYSFAFYGRVDHEAYWECYGKLREN